MRLLLFTFLLSALSFGQDRNGISYQALIINPNVEQLPGQDNDHSPLTNTDICLQFHIINSSGNYEYSESQSVTTDAYGMVNLVIGTGTPIGAITWDAVAWSAEAKSLKVDLDITGACTSFTELSNQQLTSVPFALYSPASNVPGPKGDPGDPGADGDSAYQVWLDAGNTGTEQEFLDSLKGADGTPGDPGAEGDSAYQVWLDAGNTGTEQEFLDSLKGADGKSAYDLWIDEGNTGTEQEFINGKAGADGDSAYQVWLNAGNTGTEQEFLDSLKGADGDPGEGIEGKSAYDIWIELGNTGTKQDFIDSLVGPQGEPGDSNSGVISVGGNPNNNEILSFGLQKYKQNGGFTYGFVRLSENGKRIILNESYFTGIHDDSHNQVIYEFSDQNGLVKIGNTIKGAINSQNWGLLNGDGSKFFRVLNSNVEIHELNSNMWEITEIIPIQGYSLNSVSFEGNMFTVRDTGGNYLYKKSINGVWSKILDIPFDIGRVNSDSNWNEAPNTMSFISREYGNFNSLGSNGKIQVYYNNQGTLEQKGSDIYGINPQESIGTYGKYSDETGENIVLSYTIESQSNKRTVGFRVYKFINGVNNWVQIGQDVLTTYFTETRSIKYELSNNGNRLAIALSHTKDNYGSLSVRVYNFNGTSWELGNSGIDFYTSQELDIDSVDIKNGVVVAIVGDQANKYLRIKKIY